MQAEQILKAAAEKQASDIFIVAGVELSFKIKNQIQRMGEERMMPEDTERIILEIYSLGQRDPARMLKTGDDDFSFSLVGVSRFRVSVYRQRGSLAAVVRVIAFQPVSYTHLDVYKRQAQRGTAPAGHAQRGRAHPFPNSGKRGGCGALYRRQGVHLSLIHN